MVWLVILALPALMAWLVFLSWQQIRLRDEMGMLILQLQQMAGDTHIGGAGLRSRRRFSGRIDFRIAVKLSGFIRIGESARPCRIVDLSMSGAQIIPNRGGLPLGAEGVLTIEFSDFGSSTTKARVVREIAQGAAYGVQFAEPVDEFLERVEETKRSAYQDRISREFRVR